MPPRVLARQGAPADPTYTRRVSEPTSNTESHRSERTWGRIAVAVLGSLTLVVSLVSGAGWLALNRLTGNIGTLDVSKDLGTNRPAEATSTQQTSYPPLNILIMGTDTRTGQGSSFGSAATTSSGEGHSDTVILLHISGDRTSALGVSLPRDSWVTRPACGPNSAGQLVTGKFNAAFSAGGPGCTIKAVEYLTHVRIDHFVVVNFNGFNAVVDALGGVPICLTKSINDVKSHFTMSAGTHVLNGTQALEFARLRHNIGDGSDIGRMDRQQVFMSSVVRQATSKGLVTNPIKLFSVLDAITKSLTVDPGLGTLDDMKNFATSLAGLTPKDVKFMTVPWVSRGDNENVLWVDSKASKIWSAFRNDTPYPPKPVTTPNTTPPGQKPLTVAPSQIKVIVLNGSGITGRARTAADELTALGFTVVKVANASMKNLATTTVSASSSMSEAGRTLTYVTSSTVGDTNATGSTLVLTVGKDWNGVRSVKVASATTNGGAAPSGTKSADQTVCVG